MGDDVTNNTDDGAVKHSVCFRVMGRDLEPEAISTSLGLSPTQQHKRGDANVSSAGRKYGEFSEGLWSLDSSLSAESSVDSHVKSLIAKLGGREDRVTQLNGEGLRIDIFVGVFGLAGTHGFRLSSASIEGSSQAQSCD